MATPLIDAHCHVFNKDILTYRILFRISESLIYALRHREKKGNEGKRDLIAMLESMRDIVNFLKAGLEESSTEVYEKMQRSYSKVFEQEFIATPLTFDLRFCFKGSMKEKDEELKEAVKGHSTKFKDHIESLLDLLEKEQDNIAKLANIDVDDRILEELKKLIAFLKEKLNDVADFFKEMDLVGSFKNQLEQMEALMEAYPGKVFPFYAADPRRKFIYQKIKNNVKKGKPGSKRKYCGVKIYAPNGYSPTDPDMLKIYKYCEKREIPLTAHCSHGGFATFENRIKINGLIKDQKTGKLKKLKKDWCDFEVDFLSEGWVENRAEVLNDPDIWEEVLKQFPKLKLNLAHFGNWDHSYAWTEKIFDMMHRYPTLRTDLSCTTDRTKLLSFKQLFWDKASDEVKSRFLYGSDFYLNLMFTSSFDQYVSNFKEIFNAEEFRQIAFENPVKFLGFTP